MNKKLKLQDHYRDHDHDHDHDDDFNHQSTNYGTFSKRKVPHHPLEPSFARAVSSWTGKAATDQDHFHMDAHRGIDLIQEQTGQ